MTKTPISISVTLILLLLNAFIWLAFAIIVAAGLHPAIPDVRLVKWGMAILSLLTSGTLIGLSVFLRGRRRLAYYLALGLLVTISLLTLTDDFGLPDLIVLILTVAPLVLLIKDRTWYIEQYSGSSE
jgi:hypothetical protein